MGFPELVASCLESQGVSRKLTAKGYQLMTSNVVRSIFSDCGLGGIHYKVLRSTCLCGPTTDLGIDLHCSKYFVRGTECRKHVDFLLCTSQYDESRSTQNCLIPSLSGCCDLLLRYTKYFVDSATESKDSKLRSRTVAASIDSWPITRSQWSRSSARAPV